MRRFYPYLISLCLMVSCSERGTTADHGNESTSGTEPAIDSTYCNCDELIFSNSYNHFYRFVKREGFTGKCEEFYPSGQLKISKEFFDGKLDGKSISYHENGQVWEDQEFMQNFQHKEKIIYTQSGQVKFHAMYKRGKELEVYVNKPELSLKD